MKCINESKEIQQDVCYTERNTRLEANIAKLVGEKNALESKNDDLIEKISEKSGFHDTDYACTHLTSEIDKLYSL